MPAVKVTAIGNSRGIVLPRDVLARMQVEKGDTLYLVETPDGYTLTPHDPVFAAQMDAARSIMKARRAALRELAK
jgi:putative addiction module antidote